MDMTDFYQTFFDEADELLAEMERQLLVLDPGQPEKEQLDAIFRAAHSIKGGAGTFGFSLLQETTHLLENILDEARGGALALNSKHINLFLETKDIMQDQLNAYKASEEPEQASFRYICEALRQIALENTSATPERPPEAAETSAAPAAGHPAPARYQITLRPVSANEQKLLLEELLNLGTVLTQQSLPDGCSVELQTTVSSEDIVAVLCFIIEPGQVAIVPLREETAQAGTAHPDQPAPRQPESAGGAGKTKTAGRHPPGESGSIRVAVEKVDQIINQVGELIITQAMLSQLAATLDPALHDRLINSISQLERNARDLQESVMSIRMMPMEYVFSRFPRLVHDLAGKLGKNVDLILQGGSAELDKSLIERIIDPLTHLVRNSLDHGIEPPEIRRQKGKAETGHLTLSAEHQGGNIVIEVIDDGAGLDREKILARARAQGIVVDDKMSDDDVWLLIFAPGFSTAEKVTDVSGRGVGMDVVRRNIQEMGGRVEIQSVRGAGSTMRIILPLTLAILDGMSVQVGEEIFVLPLNTVMESLQPAENALHRLTGGEQLLQVRGEYLPLVTLQQLFAIPTACETASAGIAVILQSAGTRYALLVDQLIGQHQVVVKNLELNYRKVAGISAATILGDGRVALILDVGALPAMSKKQAATDSVVD